MLAPLAATVGGASPWLGGTCWSRSASITAIRVFCSHIGRAMAPWSIGRLPISSANFVNSPLEIFLLLGRRSRRGRMLPGQEIAGLGDWGARQTSFLSVDERHV